MGTYFHVRYKELTRKEEQMRGYGERLKNISSQAGNVRNKLRNMPGSMSVLGDQVGTVMDAMELQVKSIRSMAAALSQIAWLYEKTEEAILNTESGEGIMASETTGKKFVDDGSWWSEIKKFFGWGTPVEEDEIDSVVFDDTGDYGGDQGDPQSQWGFWSEKKDLYEIVRRHYPDYSDKEIKAFLKKLNSEGCSYVAFLNTLFAAYEGREEEFERTFGFPMYKDGDLNYNELLVDYYCSTDNHVEINGKDFWDTYEDFGDGDGDRQSYDYKTDTTGRGASATDEIYRGGRYLDEKGVDYTIESKIDVTVENFSQLAEDGYVVINFFDGPLQDIEGNTVQYLPGHAMTITGTTSDGRYIVSSWGKKYYIDPSKGQANYVYYQYE